MRGTNADLLSVFFLLKSVFRFNQKYLRVVLEANSNLRNGFIFSVKLCLADFDTLFILHTIITLQLPKKHAK